MVTMKQIVPFDEGAAKTMLAIISVDPNAVADLVRKAGLAA